MAITFHKSNASNDAYMLKTKKALAAEGIWCAYDFKPDHVLSNKGQSITVTQTRVLQRVRVDGTVVDKPVQGSQYIEDYYFKVPTKKLQIVLHFTAGGTGVGTLTLGAPHSKNGHRVGVHYAVSTTGRIFELYEDEYWGDSSSAWTFNKNVIGIEIANPGPLFLDNKGDNYVYKIGKKEFFVCTKAEGHEWVYALPKPYRGQSYFLKYTPEQYESLRQLLAYLTAKHNIPYEFLPDDRPDSPEESTRFKCLNPAFSNKKRDKHGYDPKDLDVNGFSGIVSHVNWDGKWKSDKTGKFEWAKWDIGPALEWSELLRKSPNVFFPLQRRDLVMLPPPAIYCNNETAVGGNYLVGPLHNVHGGIHLFPRSLPQEVRSMAPGVIVAARLAPQGPNDQTIKLTNNYNGFVLIRHLVHNNADNSEFPIYSLYMHLAYPSWSGDSRDAYATVPWAKRLLRAQRGVVLDAKLGPTFGELRWVKSIGSPSDATCEIYKGETMDAEPFVLTAKVKIEGQDQDRVHGVFKEAPEELTTASKGLEEGKIITFHLPYFFVSAGEALGYLAVPSEAIRAAPTGFLHWEVFSPTADGGLSKLLEIEKEVGKDILNKHKVTDSSSDNYLDEADFKNLIKKACHADEKAELEELLEAARYGAVYDRLRKETASTFGKDIPTDVPLPEGMLAYGLNLVIKKSEPKLQSGTYKLVLEFLGEDGKLLPNPSAPFRQEFDVNVSDSDVKKRIAVPAGTVKIAISSPDLQVYEGTPEGSADDRFTEAKTLIKDLVDYRFRNVLLEHVTEWSQAGMESVYKKNKDMQEQFANLKDILPVTWWARTTGDFGEVPLKDAGSIFGGKDLPKDGKIENLHPVTALWLLWLLQKHDKIAFAPSPASYTGHKNPEIMYLGWALDDGKASGVKIAIGDLIGALAIRKDFDSADMVLLTAKSGGTEIELGKTQFKDGVAKLLLRAAFWGEWELKAPSKSASDRTLFDKVADGVSDLYNNLFGNPIGPVKVSIDPPVLASMTGPVVVPKSKKHDLRLKFSSRCPSQIEGIVFFRCYRLTKDQANEKPQPHPAATDPGFVLCPQALVATGVKDPKTQGKPPSTSGEVVVRFDASMLVDDFAKAVGAAEGDRVMVSAGFYGPNGGEYALAATSDYKFVGEGIVELQNPVQSKLKNWSPGDHGVGAMPDPAAPFLQFENLGFGSFSYRMAADAVVATVVAGSLSSVWKNIQVEMRCNNTPIKFERKPATVAGAKLTAFVATLGFNALKKVNAVGKGSQAKLSIKVVEGSTLGYTAADKSDQIQIVPKLASFEIVDPVTVSSSHPAYAEIKGLFGGIKKPSDYICLLGKAEWVGTDYWLQVKCQLKAAAAAFKDSPDLTASVGYVHHGGKGTGVCNDRGYFGAWILRRVLEKKGSDAEVKFIWGRPEKLNKSVWGEELTPLESAVVKGGKP